jgi:RimJ/RimL family protein N-acetyltransferase
MFAYKTFMDNPFRAVLHLWMLHRSAYWRDRAAGYHPWKARLRLLTGSFKRSEIVVPIRSLNVWHRKRIETHLLGLSPDDRYMRFGYSASDEQIKRYVKSIHFKRDDVFGIYNRSLELIAMAHLARSTDAQHHACAEFGVSVSANARGRGYGTRLFERAVMHARNHGVQVLFIHALSENTVMLKIARKAGATVEREGSESNAYLKLPPPDMQGMVSEMVDEHLAQTDYWLKAQAQDFRNWLHHTRVQRFGLEDKPAAESVPDPTGKETPK